MTFVILIFQGRSNSRHLNFASQSKILKYYNVFLERARLLFSPDLSGPGIFEMDGIGSFAAHSF